MSNGSGQATIELILPAEEHMMMCVRLTTAGALARVSLTLDAMDDVKSAVEEACNCLIRFSGCCMLHIQYGLSADALTVRVFAECWNCEPNQPNKDELYTIRCILQSMVDEVTLSGQDGGLTGILLTKRLR